MIYREPRKPYLEHGQEGTREGSPVLEDMPLTALQRSKPQMKNTHSMRVLAYVPW